MAKSGPTPWYEQIAAELRGEIDAALDAGEESPRQLHTRLGLSAWISWQNFNKYAAARRDAIAPENVNAVGGLVEAIVADYPDLTETERLLLSRMVDKLLTAQKASTIAGGLRALADLMRVRIERNKDARADEAERRAALKFDSWRSEYEAKQRERLDAANRKADQVGRDEGLSQNAIDRIKQLYGLPVGPADHGSAAA